MPESHDPVSKLSLVILNEITRRKLVDESTGFHDFLRAAEPSAETTLWAYEPLQELIWWYVNRNVDRAFKDSLKNTTHNQHTVPNFANKSLGKRYNGFVQETFFGQSVTFPKGLKSLQATYDHINYDWKVEAFHNKDISVFQNIYDLNETKLPEKFVECFLGAFEDDASRVFQRLSQNISDQRITWGERVILSCYAVLQGIRTEIWKTEREKIVNRMVERTLNFGPIGNMTEAEVKETVLNELGIEFQHFGASVLHSLTLERINLFFARRWSFFHAPDGLITSLHPLASFDSNRFDMFTGGILHPSHLMFPLGRNLLWVMSFPDPKTSSLLDKGSTLTRGENRFINEILSLKADKIYCHPDDARQIVPHLYRTDAIRYYSTTSSWEIDNISDPYKISNTDELLNFIPRRWQV